MTRDVLELFAVELKNKYQLRGNLSEAQLREEVVTLICDMAQSIGHSDVYLLGEDNVSEHNTRLDYGVFVDKLLCGYIEIKKFGKGADPRNFTDGHDQEQWKKLQKLPNLIYTDGNNWALYQNGKPVEGHKEIQLNIILSSEERSKISENDSNSLSKMLKNFLTWKPRVPTDPESLAEFIAPYSQMLKGEVENAVKESGSAFEILAKDWRKYLFPDADDSQFADAYAQTVTYALLLARLTGLEVLDPREAKGVLDKNNGILAQTLGVLGQDNAGVDSLVGFNLLRRSLEALDIDKLASTHPDLDLWLYFYENFLNKYDPKLRKKLGIYYTPKSIVRLQVSLVTELLESKFGKRLGFADDGVSFIDPGVGTGTYLVEAIQQGLEKVMDRAGQGAVPSRAEVIANNMYGFEILVGPYAVAHLRLSQIIEESLNLGRSEDEAPIIWDKNLNIFLADTLESPYSEPPGVLDPSLFYERWTEEHERARDVKNEGDILVCIGNPPYNRHGKDYMTDEAKENDNAKKNGGWVANGEYGLSQENSEDSKPILDTFIELSKSHGARGAHISGLYNDYVYFWRWALWRLFEQQNNGGIISFITPSSYLRGPGFTGMREFMRKTFDELWIIDLGGGNLSTRKNPNVFGIQIPVAIAIGVRGKQPSTKSSAKVWYTKIDAPKKNLKLKELDKIGEFADVEWEECQNGCADPFIPSRNGPFFKWPALSELFPWRHAGIKFGRTWPIAESEDLLEERWEVFCQANPEEKANLFVESNERKINKSYENEYGKKSPPLVSCKENSPMPLLKRYGYRFLDRRFALLDNRICNAPRTSLVQVNSDKNVYFSSLVASPLDKGPAIIATFDLPDLHFFFKGGNKEIFPLFRDADCLDPNIADGILPFLSNMYNLEVTAIDFACYVYAILGNQLYVNKFWNELENPDARVPITRNKNLFIQASRLGSELLTLHTYGEWTNTKNAETLKRGTAEIITPIQRLGQSYPDNVDYLRDSFEILFGSGKIGPVPHEVWEYSVSDTKVIESWLNYRRKNRIGKKRSDLDLIRPKKWQPWMDDELLELIWVIEATVQMEPQLESVLDQIISNNCFFTEELPVASENQFEPPKIIHSALPQFRNM